MEYKFDLYVNQILKNALNYPETFRIIFNTGEITLIPDRPSQLLELIRSNNEVKITLLQRISDILEDIYPKGLVEFYTKDGNIIIRYQVELEDITKREINLLVNIAKDLPPTELINLCSSTPRFNDICKSDKFWTPLFNIKFPGYDIKGIKNYKQAYVGLLWYLENKDRNNYGAPGRLDQNSFFWKTVWSKYPETLKLLLLNNVDLDYDQIRHILILPGIDSIADLIEPIFNKMMWFPFQLSELWDISAGNFNIMKMLMNYQGKDPQGDTVKLNKDHPEDFMLDVLFTIPSDNGEFIDYIVDRLPEDYDIFDYIIDSIEDLQFRIALSLIRKYKNQLTSDNINLILETLQDFLNYPLERTDTGFTNKQESLIHQIIAELTK